VDYHCNGDRSDTGMGTIRKMDFKFHQKIAGYGKRLKQVREELGLSKPKLARDLDIDEKIITRMEKYDTIPGYYLLIRLYEVYRVSPNFLLLGEGDMFIDRLHTLSNRGLELLAEHEELSRILVLMGKSYYFKHAVMAFALTYLTFNDKLIKQDIEQRGNKAGSLCLDEWGQCEPLMS